MLKNHSKSETKLYCLHLNQCDIKKCTALKLARLNMIVLKKRMEHCPRNAIILDPFANNTISIKDRDAIERFGLIVIDCSWEHTETIFNKPFRTGRNLPHLIAANNVNYGRWDRLSSAEALASALYISGLKEQAKFLLSKFPWGNAFWEINSKIFEN